MADAEEIRRIIGGDGDPGDLKPMLKVIGQLVAEDARSNFERESFDGLPWPQRYPGMADPFINIAGMVQDFIDGRSAPRANRFDPRPVLSDIGTLAQSINPDEPREEDIEIGPDKALAPYADIQQFGGTSFQTIDQDVKDKLKKWLRNNRKFSERVGFLFQTDVMKTEVGGGEGKGRKYIGVTRSLERDLADFVELWINSGGKIRPPQRLGA